MPTNLANKIGAGVLIGVDPDGYRLGVAVRDVDRYLKLMNGNQTMIVMTEFPIKKWKTICGL
jgi:phosphoglucomutase